jgi:hypothetical protein
MFRTSQFFKKILQIGLKIWQGQGKELRLQLLLLLLSERGGGDDDANSGKLEQLFRRGKLSL